METEFIGNVMNVIGFFLKNKRRKKMKNEKMHHIIAPIEISQTSSVELKRNAKGEIEIRVKVYSSTPLTAMNEANKIFLALTKKHKYGQ